ncbi:hypothetical protein N1851_013021 [Merluccius polli]|uniref:Uncharacterized protein n=1 Tax=Merluccius polli TaxID=89951 RepID=A0AA47MWE3_MERPO|nr:hypothetical protein N1851_013021 [Merluccius polli]
MLTRWVSDQASICDELGPEQQERADSPGPSCVSMKRNGSMRHPVSFKDGNQRIVKALPSSVAIATRPQQLISDGNMFPRKWTPIGSLEYHTSDATVMERFGWR